MLPKVMPLSSAGPIGIYHEVKIGETLSALSSRYAVPAGKIIDANNLSDPNGIEPGQFLYIPLKPRSSLLDIPDGYRKLRMNNENVLTHSKPIHNEGHFIWPITGSVITRFGVKKNDFVTKGIDVRAMSGAQVHASRSGTITFAGMEANGKGKMIIIDHGAGVESIYAHNSEILVKVGESIKQRDIISRVYSTGDDETFLHFEIRKNGQPVDPLQYLN